MAYFLVIFKNDFKKRIFCPQNRGDLQQTTSTTGTTHEANCDSGHKGCAACRSSRRD